MEDTVGNAVETDTGTIYSGNITFYTLTAVTLALAGYLIFKVKLSSGDYWTKYGVPQSKLSTLNADSRALYQTLLDKYGDTVGVTKGLILTRDLKLLKNIMVKDFNNFVDRSLVLVSNSPVGSSLFFRTGEQWRRLRHITTPSFTTGKLKLMSDVVGGSAESLAEFCLSKARSGSLLEVKKATAHFTCEIVARTAFGFKTGGISDHEDEFTRQSKGIFKIPKKWVLYSRFITNAIPGSLAFLVKLLKLDTFDLVSKESTDYFSSLLSKTIPARKELETSGGRKPADFLQMIISAQHAAGGSGAPDSLTDDEIIGQSMLLVFAGFETTASCLQMILCLLAQHPDVQEKVFEEIQSVVKSSKPTHEELGELKYMDQVVNESLRLYPPSPTVSRRAEQTKVYGNVTIPAGTRIQIPIFHVLRDPKHWPDPDRFDPDRFTEEAKQSRDPMAFIPFGSGPRLCIGMRFALMELKIGLVHLLRKVKFQLNESTEPRPGEQVEIGIAGVLNPKKPIKLACISRVEQ